MDSSMDEDALRRAADAWDEMQKSIKWGPVDPDRFCVIADGVEYRGREGIEQFAHDYPEYAEALKR